jgi:hypothetical protein
MKSKIFIIILLFSLKGNCQPYIVPLYFEDAVGNRDTVFFGYDDSATFGVDDFLGEKNLINESIDSTFAVFFTDATANEPLEEHCLEKTQKPTYVLKKQFNSINSFPAHYLELGLIVKNWPVSISWQPSEIENFLIQQGRQGWNVYMYSWYPPESFVGSIHCCGFWPGDYTFLNDVSQIVLNYDNLCHYSSTISKDSVSLFFMAFSSFSKVNEPEIETVHSWYNAKEKKIIISNYFRDPCSIEVIDMLGKVRIKKTIDHISGSNIEIDTGFLSRGMYILKITSSKTNSYKFTKKFQIQ